MSDESDLMRKNVDATARAFFLINPLTGKLKEYGFTLFKNIKPDAQRAVLQPSILRWNGEVRLTL